jgi:methylphosphotriester-DNA--protein-cysteine methyltransferase
MAYRELPQQSELVACVWHRDAAAEPRTHRILPDACVDIVYAGGRLTVAGPATGPVLADIPAGAETLGVRFRIGAAGPALGVPAGELLDASIALEDLWGADAARLAERIDAAATPAEQLAALATAIRDDAAPDPLVRAAATGTPREALGIGDRQLRRRFADAVGYGPKTLERVLRFQRFLTLATKGDADLARLALEAGYADQAHLTRECTRLAGLPPAALLAEGAFAAGERFVALKTTAALAA